MNKLSVSNIGWTAEQDEEAFAALRGWGVEGIEVAPSRVWPGWEGATPEAGRAFREKLAGMGYEIPAFQALLYGVEGAEVFGDEAQQEILCEHITKVAALAEAMGAKLLVFGSPRSRNRGELGPEEAFSKAVDIFGRLGEICAKHQVVLGLEANPQEYKCNFVTRTQEAIELVKAVNSPGFGLHLDLGGVTLAESAPEGPLREGLELAKHFHISEPFLKGFDEPEGPHTLYAALVAASPYERWLSIEMRSTGSLDDVERAVSFVRQHYSVRAGA